MDENEDEVQDSQETAEENARVWDEICYCQKKIDAFTERICISSKKITELEILKRSLIRAGTEFTERQQVRKEAVSRILAGKGNINMAAIFARGMQELLDGSRYAGVCSGLKEAQTRVDNKIEYFYYETDFFKSEISRYEELMSYWYGRLQQA